MKKGLALNMTLSRRSLSKSMPAERLFDFPLRLCRNIQLPSDDPAKLEKYMENIQVCGQNLLMLLNNVLDLARIENDKTEMEYSASDVEKDFRNCISQSQSI